MCVFGDWMHLVIQQAPCHQFIARLNLIAAKFSHWKAGMGHCTRICSCNGFVRGVSFQTETLKTHLEVTGTHTHAHTLTHTLTHTHTHTHTLFCPSGMFFSASLCKSFVLFFPVCELKFTGSNWQESQSWEMYDL